jgi:para-aminobenzoate synthetase component 1
MKAAIDGIQEQIRQGRFYQLNLLRYFKAALPLSEWDFLQRVLSSREPYRFFLADRSRDMAWASLSPERFCCVEPDPRVGLVISTFPIKGTLKRSPGMDPQQEGLKLFHSSKDMAELAMIIDLMRHDLSSVCKRGTVKVSNTGQVHSFASVHHLQGQVQGVLNPDLTLWDLIARICPAGSITGAPKKEVQSAIAELEGRARGFHMGNMFFISDEGWLDSSVLIRTAVGQSAANRWSFAAGSGITLRSGAESELDEMTVKTSCFGTILGEESLPKEQSHAESHED